MKKIIFILLAAALILPGCKKSTPVSGVTLDKTSIELTEGGTQTLVSTIFPADADNRNVSWSSSNPSVATVEQSGKVTAVAPGTANITVTTEDGGKTATCTVTVNANKFTVTFDVQGHGTAPASQTVEPNSKVIEPEEPEAEGFMFGGWFKESACTNAWDFEKDVVSGNITLYAKWTEAKTMAEILATNPDIPEVEDNIPPSNAWENSTDPDCKAFIGKKNGTRAFFVKSAGKNTGFYFPDDIKFAKIDENTYCDIDEYGTSIFNMTGGKFTSFEYQAVPGCTYEYLGGIYAAPTIPEGFVDLGVKNTAGKSLYWAECNLGATNPEDYGDYYMWGATEKAYTSLSGNTFTFGTKPASYVNSTWDASKGFDYKNCNLTDGEYGLHDNVFTKYTYGDAYAKSGTADGKTTLEPSDDAATQKNSKWRTPSSEEFLDLCANCVWIWTENYNSTNKSGFIVYKAKVDGDKGKANLNGTWKKWIGSTYITSGTATALETYTASDTHIFFPAAGYGTGLELYSAGTKGYYMTYAISMNYDCVTYYFSGSSVASASNHRCYGYSVRPVSD